MTRMGAVVTRQISSMRLATGASGKSIALEGSDMYYIQFNQVVTQAQMHGINAWNDAPFYAVSFSEVTFECENGSMIPATTHTWDAVRGTHQSEINVKADLIADLKSFIPDWKRWALEAFRKGDRVDGKRCLAEMRDCRQKLNALTA
ncbi:hypothetical protein [Pseudomonas sp. NA-150]|uniref:hypothetical protein n=1 Tax=Pseudomonas sp. NA-150 TaxID=3367525 RepID=UPI0037C7A5BD